MRERIGKWAQGNVAEQKRERDMERKKEGNPLKVKKNKTQETKWITQSMPKRYE